MKQALLIAVALAGMAFPAAAETLRGGGCKLPMLGLALGTVSSLIATPGTINFAATNPSSGAVSGSSAATLNWAVLGGSHLQNWTVSVQATGTFSGCTTVPISAVSVTCGTASVGGGGGTGLCTGPIVLSTVAQKVAGGAEGDGTQAYTVQLNYMLAESWRYVANSSCTLTLLYTVNAL